MAKSEAKALNVGSNLLDCRALAALIYRELNEKSETCRRSKAVNGNYLTLGKLITKQLCGGCGRVAGGAEAGGKADIKYITPLL